MMNKYKSYLDWSYFFLILMSIYNDILLLEATNYYYLSLGIDCYFKSCASISLLLLFIFDIINGIFFYCNNTIIRSSFVLIYIVMYVFRIYNYILLYSFYDRKTTEIIFSISLHSINYLITLYLYILSIKLTIV